MAFDYSSLQTTSTALIKKFGVLVTLLKFDGTSAKTYGVWAKVDKLDSNQYAAHVATETRSLYLCGDVKKQPAIGDSIVIGVNNWSVKDVEVMQPAATIIAYKILVTN